MQPVTVRVAVLA